MANDKNPVYDRIWLMLDRIKTLSNMPITDLRSHYAGFGCSEQPTKQTIKIATAKMTRGDLIVGIISEEFERETSNDDWIYDIIDI